MFLDKLQFLVGSGRVDAGSRILFVNDGSKDRTWEIISELAEKDSRFLGISQSRTDYELGSFFQAIGAKHRNENFLIACTDSLKPDVHKLFVKEKLKHGSAVFVRTVSNDLHDVDLHGYQIVAFYSPSDVKSLQESYPAFKQESLTFATYGPSTARAAEEAGLAVAIKAPAPGAPSIAEALLQPSRGQAISA